MTKTHIQATALMISAALVLALILVVAPHATVIANEVSGEVYGINTFGIAENATGAPQSRLARH